MAHDIGWYGTTVGLTRALQSNYTKYWQTRPRFKGLPGVSSSSTPWADAAPPWALGNDFQLSAGSPAIGGGGDPTRASGINSALAAGIRQYMGPDVVR